MRIDKLTTQFQQALADAQSLALANDNQYIEPLHLLAAIVNQPDGSGRALLERAGVRVPALKSAVEAALKRLPQVSGTGGEVQVGRELVNLLNLSEKEATRRGDQFIASEMFLLALTEDDGKQGWRGRPAGARGGPQPQVPGGGDQRRARRPERRVGRSRRPARSRSRNTPST